MARGWESKSIESQQDEAARTKSRGSDLSPEDRARLERRRTLELAKARMLADLEAARRPAQRDMLRRALAALEEQLRNV